MNVTAIIVTRGDVPLRPIFDSLPVEWEIVWWNNGDGTVTVTHRDEANVVDVRTEGVPDLSVYGRYAAIEYASHDICYVQDDDVIVSDPQAIVNRFNAEFCGGDLTWDGVVCNMPQEFRHNGYTEHSLVGFGAAFHRDAPQRAFEKFHAAPFELVLTHHLMQDIGDPGNASATLSNPIADMREGQAKFNRTCDVVFTGLTPRVLVDVPKENLPYAKDANRMYRQPDHVGERARMLDLVRKLK